MAILISKDIIQAAMSFLPEQHDRRQFLNGVLLKCDGYNLFVMSSNGNAGFAHRVVLDEYNTPFEFIVSKDSLVLLLTAMKPYKKHNNIQIVVSDDSSTFDVYFADFMLPLTKMTEKYPFEVLMKTLNVNSGNVVSDKVEQYDPTYLMLIKKACVLLSKNKSYQCSFNCGFGLLHVDDNNTVMVLMPYNHQIETPAIPDWIL